MLAGKCFVADPSSHDALRNDTRLLSEETAKELQSVFQPREVEMEDVWVTKE